MKLIKYKQGEDVQEITAFWTYRLLRKSGNKRLFFQREVWKVWKTSFCENIVLVYFPFIFYYKGVYTYIQNGLFNEINKISFIQISKPYTH